MPRLGITPPASELPSLTRHDLIEMLSSYVTRLVVGVLERVVPICEDDCLSESCERHGERRLVESLVPLPTSQLCQMWACEQHYCMGAEHMARHLLARMLEKGWQCDLSVLS